MVSNLEINNLSTLPKGKVYIVKAPSDILAWELKLITNLQVHYSISSESLSYLIQYPDYFSTNEENYLTVYHPKLTLPSNLQVSNRTRLFIWIPSVKGTHYKDSEETFINNHKHEPYTILDLSTLTYNKNPYFLELSKQCLSSLSSADIISIPIILEEFKNNPLKLNYLLTQPKLLVQLPLVQDLLTITNIIGKLATSKPDYSLIKRLTSFPKTTLNHLVINPHLKYCLLYKILKGTYSYKNKNNTIETLNCPSLWVWFEILYTRISPKYFNYPEYIIKLFFSWVYSCNTKFNTPNARGFYEYTKYKNKVYLFEPSEEAIKYFYTLF